MRQRNLYKHLKEQRLIVSEDLIKDNSLYWFTDAQYQNFNHNQRASIRYQLKSCGMYSKVEELKNLPINK